MAAVLLSERALSRATTITIAEERIYDVAAREALLDRAMGEGRTRKSSEKLRRNRLPAEGLALVARHADGEVAGTVRLWNIQAGVGKDGKGVPALLLGPLAVDPRAEGQGIGSALMREAVRRAGEAGHGAILLVGDAPYYARFGFSAEKTEHLVMPGPFERNRFLALELVPGWLDGATGLLTATGSLAKHG
ncbi:GNAT family N-acetyltransferase [Gellertiella hungarica]|uniref:Putative N-acetyltransferase YhbS n=1 Tax=Gellertiella hungarica TaxID=1572859 RepID=A0A7W6J2Q7_9HYPH|nr:N-acetyltransferase [Gellertiella hungarica]MBB4063017.1 putative N-acetyltransferase YhbS [Gellertiella hungarica]